MKDTFKKINKCKEKIKLIKEHKATNVNNYYECL